MSKHERVAKTHVSAHDMKNMGGGMDSKMAKMGLKQGDMAPHVEDYQAKMSDYSQEGFNKTLEYIERQDKFRGKEARDIKSQAYQGRYS